MVQAADLRRDLSAREKALSAIVGSHVHRPLWASPICTFRSQVLNRRKAVPITEMQTAACTPISKMPPNLRLRGDRSRIEAGEVACGLLKSHLGATKRGISGAVTNRL
jgi:hypothetical protein